MRFITEFELAFPYTLDKPYAHMESAKHDMGHLLQETFGFKEKTYHDQRGGNEINRWSLEIEAFPMDKWIEFKSRLMNNLEYGSVEYASISDLLNELESFGKPAGEAKELNQ
jgi:hypothetical protein